MKKESSEASMITRFIVVATLSFLIFFFLGERYSGEIFWRIIITVASAVFFLWSWRHGFFHFLLPAVVGISVFISLEVSFFLPIWVIFIVTFIAMIWCFYLYKLSPTNDRCSAILFLFFIIVWGILAFDVRYRHDWILENVLTVPFVLFLVIIHKWFKLSKTSYILLYIYTFFHIVGGHYTYAEVPFGDWMKSFFNLTRNHYDRIVHFLFGFLLAYPVREIYMRVGGGKGIWALWIPIELTFGLSAIYEIIEWLVAVIFGGDLGIAYLGAQGDSWDAQKDMGLAGLGAIIAMVIVFVVLLVYHKKEYLKELKESFSVKHKRPLGEEALAHYIKQH